jgi:hypothetical protein
MLPASASRGQQGVVPGTNRGIEASFGQRRQGFSEAIVFTVGGGSIDEYGNLQEWATRTSGAGAPGAGPLRRIVYGSTEIMSAESFISELEKLGQENTSK